MGALVNVLMALVSLVEVYSNKTIIERIDRMESKMAQVDQEMRERLDAASTRVAERLDSLLDKVAALEVDRQGAIDAALLEDAQRDADALRPSVEFLERLGSSDSEISPEVDPVPADGAAVEDAPVIDQPTSVAPSEAPIVAENDTENESDDSNQNR